MGIPCSDKMGAADAAQLVAAATGMPVGAIKKRYGISRNWVLDDDIVGLLNDLLAHAKKADEVCNAMLRDAKGVENKKGAARFVRRWRRNGD